MELGVYTWDYGAKPWKALYPPHWREAINPLPNTMPALAQSAIDRQPDSVAIRYFDEVLTFSDVARLSDIFANWLLSRGLSKGDRIAIILQNVPEFIIAAIGIWKIGAIVVPANPMYRADELARLLLDCAPKVVLMEEKNLEETRRAVSLAGIEAILLTTRGAPAESSSATPNLASERDYALDFATLFHNRDEAAPPRMDVDPGSPGLILYTSGTTGCPKGAVISHASLAYNSKALCRVAELDSQSRILALAPLFHITGFTCHLGAFLAAACTIILPYRVVPETVLQLIREYRPTYTIGAITAFNALLNSADFRPDDFASFTRIASGGAPIPPSLRDRIGEVTARHIDPAYGMTETAAQAIYSPPHVPIPIDPVSGALSIGIPTPDTEIVVVDENDRAVPTGTVGELWVRGPQVMSRYWNKKAETDAAMVDGWLRTGDVAFMDGDGWIYLVDRKKDVIIASGFKVWPREVEDVLYLHPAVREAAVVGIPDSYRGETVKAYVSLRDGHTASVEEISYHCSSRLAAYKRPRFLEFMDDLPKTPTGKIQRNALRTTSPAAEFSSSGD